MARNFSRSFLRRRIACATVFLLLAGGAYGQDLLPSGKQRPVGQAAELPQSPQVDGVVQGDPAWSGVAPLTGLTQTCLLYTSDAADE